ncbi:hypothetical protein MTR_8g021390 [Medicago truncatula]|uniref:Uncharacterized protein n=1 Tax=Medicago truncatula TaxID=3880 RepID=A0A072TMS3_MEDTR|nr:hypothetical protein MTR_8g021390 [Medicago truncatula]
MSSILKTRFLEIKRSIYSKRRVVSLNAFDLEEKLYPLVYGGDAPDSIEGFDQQAKQTSPGNNGDAEFGYGVGEINPVEALNPGLADKDSIRTTVLPLIIGDEDTCFNTTYTSAGDLNYPSFALNAPSPKHRVSGSFIQTITNVGLPISIYNTKQS